MIRARLPAVLPFDIKDMPWQAQFVVLLAVLVVIVICQFLRYWFGRLALEKTGPSQVADVVAAVVGRQRPEGPRTRRRWRRPPTAAWDAPVTDKALRRASAGEDELGGFGEGGDREAFPAAPR